MAQTTISDLWTPDIWIQGASEKARAFPSLINSPVVVRSPVLDAVASGAGITANIPFYKDVSDDLDEIQVQDTAPTNGELTSGLQVVPILNRVKSYDVTALAGQVSGATPAPIDQIFQNIGFGRTKRFQRSVIQTLRGVFGGGDDANGSASCLTANRVEAFTEAGLGASTNEKMSPDLFITACALMGELDSMLEGGAIWTHPNVVAQLNILDKQSFKDGVESGLGFKVRTYRGIPIFTSRLLARAGTIDGFVYETFILSQGCIGFGMKAQSSQVGDVSSLILDETGIAKNNLTVFDRNRYCVHVNGTKWGGTPAGQSATEAELATIASWTLVYQSADRVGAALIRTNG